MKYKTIRYLLRRQVEEGKRAFWTFNEEKKEFTQIYNNYTSELTIYTPKQLLNRLDEISM
tara:strand:+ start:6701 stop:6880 length:180 start_codon:yes stop_codon:yes gene_type:complete